MVERIDIERALEKLADDEAGFRFQSLAVVLAKLRWRDLIASERHKDRGLDAYVSAADSTDGRGKGLACSTTGTLRKVSDDAAQAQKHYPDISLLVFYTTEKVTQEAKAKWTEEIRQKFRYELVVASREEIITTLQIPDNAQLCRSHLDIQVPYRGCHYRSGVPVSPVPQLPLLPNGRRIRAFLVDPPYRLERNRHREGR